MHDTLQTMLKAFEMKSYMKFQIFDAQYTMHKIYNSIRVFVEFNGT